MFLEALFCLKSILKIALDGHPQESGQSLVPAPPERISGISVIKSLLLFFTLIKNINNLNYISSYPFKTLSHE